MVNFPGLHWPWSGQLRAQGREEKEDYSKIVAARAGTGGAWFQGAYSQK